MQPVSYFAHLEALIGDDVAIEREKAKLDSEIIEMSGSIKAAISGKSVTGLIWYLAVKELERVRPLVGIPISDFAGHARFLRALAAAVPFDTPELGDDPGTDSLLETCGQLWLTLFFREMMDDLKHVDGAAFDADKRRIAAFMSLLHAVQGERAYIEQAEAHIPLLWPILTRDH